MDNNIFSIAEEKKSKTVQKLKTGIQKYLIFIVLLFNVAISIISRLYTFGLRNPFTLEFFINLAFTTMITTVCYVCFIPFGYSEEQKRTTEYPRCMELWKALSENVRSGFLRLFEAFCDEQVITERNDAKKLIIDNNTIIPFSEYKEKYEKMSKKQLKELYKSNKISKRDYKAILNANGYGFFNPTKIKRINPVIILSAATKTAINDAGRTSKSKVFEQVMERPLLMFFPTAILNSVVATFCGGNENVIIGILISILQIIIAAICGYSAGVSNFKYNYDRINSRIIFISLFCEKNKIQTKTPSN